jgi:hypothetical protein
LQALVVILVIIKFYRPPKLRLRLNYSLSDKFIFIVLP